MQPKLNLEKYFIFINSIKSYFNENHFIEVITPPIVENPGMEPHIHPFGIYQAKDKKQFNLFLNTSPEFKMKEILTNTTIPEFNNIYSLNYSFRNEPESPIHRPQFLMLEWYRKNAHYEQIMKDCFNLINFLNKKLGLPTINFLEKTVDELFLEYCNFSILDFTNPKILQEKILKDFKEVPLPSSPLAFEDLFFLLWLNIIEPKLINFPFLIIKEWPIELAALSMPNPNNPKTCLRFELFLNGIEVANCFEELTDYNLQAQRFKNDLKLKEEIYNYSIPWPNEFLKNLQKGLPKSSGIALGVERLYGILCKEDQIFFS